MRICLVTREEICTYWVKENVTCCPLMQWYWKHLWGCIHHIISYYTCHHICIRDILFHAHAYRIVRRDNSFGVQRGRRGGSVGDASGHSSRRRGANSRGAPWVPRSSANLFPQRQAPKHSKSPIVLQNTTWVLYVWCIML